MLHFTTMAFPRDDVDMILWSLKKENDNYDKNYL